MALLMLVGVALDAAKPWPLKLLVDNVLSGQPLPAVFAWMATLPGGDSSPGLLAWAAGATIVVFLASWTVGITQSYLQTAVLSRMVYDLGEELFDRLQRASLRFHRGQRAGDLVRRVTTDCDCVRKLVVGVFFPVLTSLASLSVMFVVMWRLDWSLSLLAVLAALPLGAFIRVFARPMAEREYAQQQLEGEIMALAEQTLTALPIVQAYGREEHEDGRFRSLSRQTVQAYLRTLASQLQFQSSTSAVTATGTAAVMVVGGLHVLQGSLSVGSLLVFLAYLASLYAPLEALAYVSAGFASAKAGARRVLEVLDGAERVPEALGAKPAPARRPGYGSHVRLESVVFGYEPGRPVLHGVSLDARPGETIALVGPTGAGKSTLVSLVPRFVDPWEGRVILDGIDVRELQTASLRDRIALVLQEPFLLPLTIAENIAYGRPDASHADIVDAARAAHADDFIRQLPRGYDTVLGERGATLSGGEKQRLAIARAFLKDAPVLILDEPTSALDAQTEALLLDALDRLTRHRTTFTIAHRLSTIRRADRIVVLDQGRIVETGTHAALLAAGGLYQHLHRLQFARADGVGAESPR